MTTNQTHANHNTNIGASAAVAATNGNGHADQSAGTANKKKRERRKAVFVVIGDVLTFKNRRAAEEYLNSSEAPEAGEFEVITGEKVTPNTRSRITLK